MPAFFHPQPSVSALQPSQLDPQVCGGVGEALRGEGQRRAERRAGAAVPAPAAQAHRGGARRVQPPGRRKILGTDLK